MSVPAPHFLLFSESSRYAPRPDERSRPQWRFVLEAVDGSMKLEAADEEPEARGDRLDLLAVVRGLEALDQPSRVTLLTPSQYVSRGMRFGLEQWRETDWQWERFGQLTPVKNWDLWQRVDRALNFHEVEVRGWRIDAAEAEAPKAQLAVSKEVNLASRLRKWIASIPAPRGLARRLRHAAVELAVGLRRRLAVARRSAVA